jgi:putative flavoprotein involved in K+ transport
VFLATSGNGWFPRRYRGKDNVRWRDEMGFFDRTVDTLKSPADRMAAVPTQTGKDGGHDLNHRTLAALGVILTGRLVDADASRLRFAPDLDANMTRSDAVARTLLADIDAFIERTGAIAPANERDQFARLDVTSVDEIDLGRAGVSAVIWATGYDLDFGWIDIPAFDAYGYPVQRRGVTEVPGLYFLGLHFMHTRKSGLIWGVGDDANHVVDHIAARRGTMVVS